MRVRSVTDTLLGEAVSGTPEERFRDMVAIASAIQNRANALGVTPEQVVSNPSEFNAFGKSLPPGTAQYRDLARQALGYVNQYGPVHPGMFYATPSAVGNLPSGLKAVGKTKGHMYFSDPKARAINTAIGYRQPSLEAQQQLGALASMRVPTPSPRPPSPVAAAPVSPVERQTLAPQETQMDDMGLLGRTARFADPKDRLRAGLLAQRQDLEAQAAQRERDKAYQAAKAGLAAQLSATNHPANTLDGVPSQPSGPYDAIGYNFRTLAPTAPAPTPGYVDPMVTKVAPPSVAPPEVTPPATAYTPTPTTPRSVQAIDQQTTAGVGGPVLDKQAQMAAKQATMDHKVRGILGTIGAAAIGGLLGGPIGAALGGYLGKTGMDKMDGFPSKPSGNGGLLDSSHRDAVESKSNQDRVGRSSQAQSVSKSGAAGLF